MIMERFANKVQLYNSYIMLSGALEHNNNFKEAYDYQNKYIALKDSVFNERKAKEFNELRTQYDVEKKDHQISLLEKETELAATKRKWIITLSALISLVLVSLFLFYRHSAKTQKRIREQEQVLYEKETERIQKERELATIRAEVEGKDKERHRIAKELHDGVGGQLASVTMSLFHLNSNWGNENITNIQKVLGKTFKEIRGLSHSLSSSHLSEKTLEILIFDLKQHYEKMNAFTVEVSTFPEDCLKNISAVTKHNLYRVLQELFNNTYKYANASLVQLTFNVHKNILVVVFEDNGIGFDTNYKNEGIGLKNIHERIISVNGKIHIDSHKHRGTVVNLEIPI